MISTIWAFTSHSSNFSGPQGHNPSRRTLGGGGASCIPHRSGSEPATSSSSRGSAGAKRCEASFGDPSSRSNAGIGLRQERTEMTQKQTLFKGQSKKKTIPPNRHGKAPHVRKGKRGGIDCGARRPRLSFLCVLLFCGDLLCGLLE